MIASKFIHFLTYGVIAWLAAYSTRGNDQTPWALKIMVITVLTGILGIIAELIQSTTPGRDASLYDIYADLIGACFFLVLFKLRYRAGLIA